MMTLSDPLRGVVLLHEMLHFNNDNLGTPIAEGQGWGLEIAFFENLKESESWKKLSKAQQETINDRIRGFLADNHPEQQKNLKRTAILFKILLRQARGFEQPQAVM